MGRAQNDKFLTVGVRNTPTMFCITSARVDESVAVAAPMPMVPTRAVMLTGAAAASAVVAATCSDNSRKPKLRKFLFSAHAVEVVMASAVLTVDDLLSAIFASFDAWDGRCGHRC